MNIKLANIYKNLGGTSTVSTYEIGLDFIKVEFKESGLIYKYSYRTAGKTHVEKMKKLAAAGNGLGKYIGQHIRMK